MKACIACNDIEALITPSGLCCLCFVYLQRTHNPSLANLPTPKIQGCVKCGEGLSNHDKYCPDGTSCAWFNYEFDRDTALYEDRDYDGYCDCGFYEGGNIYGENIEEHAFDCEAVIAWENDEPAWCGFDTSYHQKPPVDKHSWCHPCAVPMGRFRVVCKRCLDVPLGQIGIKQKQKGYCTDCYQNIVSLRRRGVSPEEFKQPMEKFLHALCTMHEDWASGKRKNTWDE